MDFSNDPKGTMSEWVQSTLLRSKIPVAEIAAKVRKSEDLIYKYANCGAENNIPAWALVIVMSVCEDYTILHKMAEMFRLKIIPQDAWDAICQGIKLVEGDQ